MGSVEDAGPPDTERPLSGGPVGPCRHDDGYEGKHRNSMNEGIVPKDGSWGFKSAQEHSLEMF